MCCLDRRLCAIFPLSACVVRGRCSFFGEAGLKNVRVTGDPVVAMHRGLVPATSPARRIVAINAGRSEGRVWGDEETVLASLADAARRLHAAGWTVRFVPVWDKDEEPCRDVARRAGLSDADVEPLILDARQWIGMVRQFDVIVTLKLHAAVLAAVAGTPFVPLEYRPKVRDFCESIGWVDHLMRTDEFTGERVERAVRALYDDLPAARAASAIASDHSRRNSIGMPRNCEKCFSPDEDCAQTTPEGDAARPCRRMGRVDERETQS